MEIDDYDFSGPEFKKIMVLSKLENDFRELLSITDKWGYLRQIYMEMLPWIMEKSRTDIVTPVNPYPVDWSRYFSPIESMAWMSIRNHYMALYPQYPVFNYFIDFANPYLRIGLELDGKDYHDPKKDKIRDEMLWRYGWRIFRVTGRECVAKFLTMDQIDEAFSYTGDESERDSKIRHWMMNTSDGVIRAIKEVYFTCDRESELYLYALDTLRKHRLAQFPVILTDNETISF